ncbi:MAG: MFS transporter [Magnetococcales bacterium]|nr:MFS transporter [Magnetococcales bacterium]
MTPPARPLRLPLTTPSRWPIMGFYACYFAVVGVWIPYWPLHLASLGYSAQAIGLLTALTQWIRIPAPPLWAGLADRGCRYTVILTTCVGSLGAFCLFFLDSGPVWILAVTVLFSIFHTGPLALTDATAMELAVKHRWDYGRLRLWGSWGFILFSLAVGPLSDRLGLETVPVVIALLLGATALCAAALPRSPAHTGQQTPLTTLFARPDVRWFYFSAAMMQFSHGGYYGFMSLHLQQHDFNRTTIGLLWAVGVLAEVLLMNRSQAILDRFGVARLLTFSLLVATVRWCLYAATTEIILLACAQLLHGFTFGTFHVASVRRVHDFAPPDARGTAQGWLSALSYGMGGGLGVAISGVFFQRFGHEALFLTLAFAALVGTLASRHAATLLAARPPETAPP